MNLCMTIMKTTRGISMSYWISPQCVFFEPQPLENSERISVMLESEFIRDHKQIVEHNLNSEVDSMEQQLYFLHHLEMQHEFYDPVDDWMNLVSQGYQILQISV